jgi:FADH2 O2-dependent halogenase
MAAVAVTPSERLRAVQERETRAAAYGSGFTDALFSRGLANATEFISALAPRLLQALKDDDFSTERFEYLEQLHRNSLANNDRLVNSCYISFRDYDLWNAWFRIWALGVGLGDLRLANALRRYTSTRDESILPDAEEPMGLFYSNHQGFKALFDDAVASTEAVDEGRVTAKEAANHIFELVRNAPFAIPALRLGDPRRRYVAVGEPLTLARTVGWLLTSAPPDIKTQTFGSVSDMLTAGLRRKKAPMAAPRATSSGASTPAPVK